MRRLPAQWSRYWQFIRDRLIRIIRLFVWTKPVNSVSRKFARHCQVNRAKQPATIQKYERNGVAHLILFYAPFIGWRRIQVGDHHKAVQWAHEVRRWVDEAFPKAKRITLVMDHLNTHTGASLYKAFPPEEALR